MTCAVRCSLWLWTENRPPWDKKQRPAWRLLPSSRQRVRPSRGGEVEQGAIALQTPSGSSSWGRSDRLPVLHFDDHWPF